ncbi:hypothetical protein V1506DRAFT_130237 [Lipomyces tetrasporus]
MAFTISPPELSFSESYRLMNTARSKLSQAAHTNDHDLRVLVSHANFLDAIMAHLDHKDVPTSSPHMSSPRRTVSYDATQVSRYSDDTESDSESDSDSDSDSDGDDSEEYLLVPSSGRTLSPVAEASKENSADEDGDDIMEPLNDLRSQLYAIVPDKKRSVTFSPDFVERTPRDRRQVQFSVHEIPREHNYNRIPDQYADYFADDDGEYADDNDNDDVDDDDMTFYEVANKHKHEYIEEELDDDMPPLTRVKSHVVSPHALPPDEELDRSVEPALPHLTDATTVSDDDLQDIIAYTPRGQQRTVRDNTPVSGHSITEMDMFSRVGTPEAANYAMSWVA